jgi:hypothetical protein
VNGTIYTDKIVDEKFETIYYGVKDYNDGKQYSIKDYFDTHEVDNSIGLCISLGLEKPLSLYMYYEKVSENKMELFFSSNCMSNNTNTHIELPPPEGGYFHWVFVRNDL